MEELFKMCLIVCPLVFLGSFVDSVAGGGGLITLPAYMMAGLPVHLAAGTNKAVAGLGSITAAAGYFRGGKVHLRIALWAAAGSLVGGFVGAQIANMLSDALLRGLMLAALPAVAIFLAVKKDFGREEGKERNFSRRKAAAVSLAIGLGIGLYDGIIGPGTGTFLIMAFTAFLSLDMVTASGCAKVGNLASNVAAAVSYIMSGNVLWILVLPASLCSIVGGYCGAMFAIRGGGKRIRGMIFLVLGMLFVKTAYEFFA